ncbi:MAG: Holliday junction resolvase RuvX [Deltaproteobacteria bacterium]|nr:Holliday junction resolvase RuvX [Deltaproteobacteria bacterium]
MKYLGIDLGKKRIGIALSDDSGIIAEPYIQIERRSTNSAVDEIFEIVKEKEVNRIVIGLPLLEDGNEGSMAKDVLKFKEVLETRCGLHVTTWDERFSTKAVTRVLIDADVSRKKRKNSVDKLSASFILQGYLDYIKNDQA